MSNAKNIQNVDSDGWTTVVEPFPETFDFQNAGDSIVGVYDSVKQLEQEDLQNPGETRTVNVYTIAHGVDGKKYGVWGGYSIDKAFESIAPGTQVRIVFEGKVGIDGGKRSVKQFTVQTR